MRHFLIITVLALLPAIAAAEDGVEVNLDALDALDPDRDQGRARLPAPPPLPETDTPPEIAPDADGLAVRSPQRTAAPEPDEAPPATVTDPALAQALSEVELQLRFDTDSANLSLDSSNQLDQVAALALKNPVRVQVKSWSGQDPKSDSSAQRMALKRAIEIRGYLMTRGVDGSRIDLKPSGKPERQDHADMAHISLLPQ